MKDYVEKALQFIESAEMRDYLRTCPDRLWSSGDGCAAIVRNAPVSLERKIPVMDLIAEQTGSAEAVKFAKAARFALNERIANHTPETSIWANHHYFSGSNGIIRHMQDTRNDFLENHLVNPLATYGNTLQYVMDMPRRGSDWYSIGITNYDPNIHFMPKECIDCDEDIECRDCEMNEERDKSIECCTWILNTSGEILYFTYEHCDSDEEPDRYESFGHDFCLPVPFEPGDIVLWDCHPFMEPMRVLILDIGDNRDCCDVQCLFMRSAEKIDYCPFAHLSKWIRENTYTSPLYRATRWQKKLPQSEAPLELLGAAIKTAPSFGLDIIRYIDAHGKCNANPLWNQGVEWKALLNECNMLKEKRIL